jgi:dihydroflavonol-4-reductase
MRVLVTGATGFVGWHTAAVLRAAGHTVCALVRSREKATRCLGPLGIHGSDVVVGDIGDAGAVTRALTSCDAAVHAAAAVSVTTRGGDAAFDANVTGTRLVVGGACERGLRFVLFVSSLTAIFDPHAPPGTATTADSPLVQCATRYGRSKADADRFVRELQASGAPVATVYPSGVIGPDDPGLSESVRAYRTFLRGTIRTGGTQFVDARDLADFHLWLLESGRAGRHVAAGHYFAWDELTSLIEDVTGAVIPRIAVPAWLARGMGSAADLLSRVTGRRYAMTREGLEIATRWRPIADSPSVAEAGIGWRDPRVTLADMLRWYVAAQRLRADAVPKLAPPATG